MTGVASRSYLPTPLHARTAELCATNSWTEDGGFTIPALYTSAREEQGALVSRVALCDLSARQCWSIQGPDGAAFLSTATVSDVQSLDVGQTVRTAWCDDQGYVRGDGSIARLGETEFELWTTVRDFAWFVDGAHGFDVKLVNATGLRAVIGVRGPLAQNILAASGLSGEPVSAGQVLRPDWRPAQIAITRDASGDGVELSMQADDGVVVWDRLWRAGAALGAATAGAQALDNRRIENGVPKAGIDWRPAQFARAHADLRLPAELGFTPDLNRRFNGAAALRLTKSHRGQVLAQFSSDEPLTPGPMTLRGAPAGILTSQSWSHTRACTFALGWLDPDAVKIGTKLSVPGPSGPLRAEIVREVFAKPVGA